MKYGERPIRTTCGIDYGVNEINSLTEKYQLDLLKDKIELQKNNMLQLEKRTKEEIDKKKEKIFYIKNLKKNFH